MPRTSIVLTGLLLLPATGCTVGDMLTAVLQSHDDDHRHSDQQLKRMGYERGSDQHRQLILEENSGKRN